MKSKRLLFLHEGTFPDGFAMTNRLKMYMKMLVGNNNPSKIIIPRRNQNFQFLEYEETEIDFLWDKPIHTNIFLRKISYLVQDLKWAKYIFKNRKQIDIIFIAAMSIWPMFLITVIGKLFKKTIVCELNEFPFSSQGGNYIDDLKYYKIFRRKFMEFAILKHIHSVISISNDLTQYIKKINSKIIIIEIPILCDVMYFKSFSLNMNSKTPDHKYIVHASHLSEYKDGFLTVLNAIGSYNLKLNDLDKIHIYITSNQIPPLLLESVNEVIINYELKDYIHFIGYQDDGQLFNLYSNASFLVINKPINLQNKYNFPTKLSEYLYFSKALIVSVNTAMSNYLKNELNCLIFKNNDSEDLLNTIHSLMEKEYRNGILNIAGKNTVENNFDFNVHKANFQNVFLING